VGNKFDLLPNTGPLFEKSIVECLLHNCSVKGIRGEQVKHVELISAKTGYNVERLITRLFKLWNDEGDVYLLGMANAGKSMLFNKLLSSDYCRSLASEAIVRATTSFWPGTTLNMLKFPINFLTSSKKSTTILLPNFKT
jgi:ribosome biogenesis GTPase A